MTPVDPRLVAAAIDRAGIGNPLLGIGTGTGTPGTALIADARPLVDAVGAGLGHPERRVAASLTVLGYAARLVGPTLAVLLRDGILLDTDPARVHHAYAPGTGFTLTMPDPAGWAPVPLWDWGGTVVDAHLARVIQAVRQGEAVGTPAEPPPTLDTTLEFDVNAGAIMARRWSRHPRCWC